MQANPVFEEAKRIVNTPLAQTLASAGIVFKEVSKSNGVFYNLQSCPICSGSRKRPHAYECGFSESPASSGRFNRAYKCFDGGNEDQNFLWEALLNLGLLTNEQVGFLTKKAELKLVPAAPPLKKPTAVKKPVFTPKAYSVEWGRRLYSRLISNPNAVAYLHKRGWTEKAIKYFRLGLSEKQESKAEDGQVYVNSDYLVAPVKTVSGDFVGQYAYYQIPGVTVEENPSRGKGFCRGAVSAYFSAPIEKQVFLIVCDGLKDLWTIWEQFQGTELEHKYLLVSSTHGGSNVPESLRDGFFNQFEKVYMAHDNDKPGRDKNGAPKMPAGDAHALKWASLCTGNAYRVKPSGEIKDWNDFFCAGHSVQEFLSLLADADSLNCTRKVQDELKGNLRTEYSPVTIEGEFHNGYMYYVVQTQVQSIDEDGNPCMHLETVAVRSDKTLHKSRRLPAPKGITTPPIYQLYPDGTIISGPLKPNPYATWNWRSIDAYLSGESRTPSLKTLLSKVERHLRASAYLPVDYDYAILATAVVASYCQRIFDAVPLLLLTGEAGSGKSTLAKACSDMAANSPQVTGVLSAATLARQINDSKGFIAIDDLESLGQGTKDSEFGDLVQSLKLSYNKSTATKVVTNSKKNFAIERLDFFGIKLINNTSGVGHILGTRMFKIQTRVMPPSVKLASGLLNYDEIAELRNMLHSWVFEHVEEIAQTYKAIFPSKSNRQEEISAPLKVIGTLSEDEEFLERLELGLARQGKLRLDYDSPEEILGEAIKRIIKRSLDETGELPMYVSITQAQLEAASLVNIDTYGKESSTQLSSLQKEIWVGRTIHNTYSDPTVAPVRTSLYAGKSIRAYQLRQDFLDTVVAEYFSEAGREPVAAATLPVTKEFRSFCRKCESCEYAPKCEIREQKMEYVASLKKSNPNKMTH